MSNDTAPIAPPGAAPDRVGKQECIPDAPRKREIVIARLRGWFDCTIDGWYNALGRKPGTSPDSHKEMIPHWASYQAATLDLENEMREAGATIKIWQNGGEVFCFVEHGGYAELSSGETAADAKSAAYIQWKREELK